ncbi:MAG: single-stranded DNA-binding protein [Patescibacteria group bacterium]
MNLNKVILIGRLTQDPEARTTPSGQNVTTVNMATNRVWTDATSGRKEATEFHRVVAWGKLGDIASKYLTKGGLVMIEGRLQTRSWDDKETGKKRYMTEIIAENLQMGPRAAGTAPVASFEPGSYRHPIENTNSSSVKQSPAEHTVEPEIPIIDENEPLNAGVEEDEIAIKEKDLPF